jgi:hypothetical protein
MRRLKLVGLCAMAVFAIGAVQVASASAAAPEFGRCVKKAKAEGSGYSNAGCTTAVASGAKYEWVAGVALSHFTSSARFVASPDTKICLRWAKLVAEGKTEEAEGLLKKHHLTPAECERILKENEGKGEADEPATLETTSGERVECSGISATGEYTGAKTVGNVGVKFTGCEMNEEVACASAAASAGEIVTNTLSGGLGIIKAEGLAVNDTVGISLAATSGEVVAEFDCGTLSVVVTGSVIHQVTTNKMQLEEDEKYVQRKGEQKPEKFEGEPTDVLESTIDGIFHEQSGEELLTTLVNEEKVEVNTVV